MIRREHKIIAVAAGIGLTVAGGLWWLDSSRVELVSVVVAAHDLQARQIIRDEDLTTVPMPPAAKDSKAIHQPSQLVGKTLISPVFAGEQFRPNRVGVGDRELGPDDVAMGFKTDIVNSAGGILSAGDVVDVYVVPGDANGQPAAGRRVDVFKVGEGYRVYSVRDGNARETGPVVNTADPTRSQGLAGIPVVVDLKVPTEHVAGLKQASTIGGTVTFVKRSPDAPVPEKPIFIPLPVTATQVDVRGVPLSSMPGVPSIPGVMTAPNTTVPGQQPAVPTTPKQP